MEEYTGEVIPLSSGLKPYDGDIIPVDSTSARSKFAATDSRRVDIPKGIIASNIQSDDNPDTGIDGIQSMPFVPTSESNQAAVRRVDNATDAAPQTSGSVVKDVGVNLAGGAVKGLSDFGKVINTVIGRNDAVQSADDLNSDVSQWQKENGGDTFYGKVSDMVGAIVPTLAVGEGKLVQFAVNAGWFGIPAFQKTLDSELEQGTDPATAGVRAIRDFAVNMVLPDAAKFGGSKLGAKLGTDAMGAAGKVADTALAAPVMGGLDVATQVAGNASNVAEGKDSKDIDWERAAVAATGASALHAVPHALGAGADLARTASDEAMWRINPQAQAARELARGMDDTSLNAPDLNTGIVQNQYVSDQGANGKIGDANLPVQYEQGTAINPNLTRPTPDDVLKTNSVDDAITVSNASLPDVTVDTSKPGIADALGKIRPIDTTIQDKLEREEYDSLDQKSKGYTDDTGNTVQPASLDVNEQRRYDELTAKLGETVPGANDAGAKQTVGEGVAGADDAGTTQPLLDAKTRQALRDSPPKDIDFAINGEIPKGLEQSALNLEGPLSDLFGHDVPVVPFHNPEGSNGFYNNGKVYINTASPTRAAGETGLHEAGHLVFDIAKHDTEAGETNTPAQQFRDKIMKLADLLSPADRADYVNKFMKEGPHIGPDGTADLNHPLLKEEMMMDFLGNRATDATWMSKVVKSSPEFVQKWLGLVNDLISRFSSRTNSQSQSAKVDSYFGKDLEHARDTAAQALSDYRDAQGERFVKNADGTVKIYGDSEGLRNALTEGGIKSFNVNTRGGYATVGKSEAGKAEKLYNATTLFSKREAGVIAEVAPHPGDKDGNQDMRDRAELKTHWDSMSDSEKISATRGIGRKVIDQAQHITGQRGWDIEFSSGSFKGTTNPNFLLKAPAHATDADISEIAKVVGHMLDQQAMISFDEGRTLGKDVASFVKIELPKQMSRDSIEALRNHLRAQGFDGDTLRDGGLYFGNWSGKSDSEFYTGIDSALGSFEFDGEAKTVLKQFKSDYIEPDSREDYLKGTHYESDKTGTEAGGDVLRGRQGRDTLERVSREIESERKRWTDNSPAGRESAQAIRHRLASSADGGQGAPTYGEPREGSASAVGVHYSQQPRTLLSSEYVGTGLRGADNTRFDQPQNSGIRPRLNFYVDNGNGIHPESGVGGVAHRVNLHNLYDVAADPLGLVKNMRGATEQERSSNFERSVKDAGFSGYLSNKDSGHQDYAVLIGKHAIDLNKSTKFSAREDYYNPGEIDHLGSFDLDRDYAESSKDKFDFPDLSKADKKLDAAALTPEEKAEQFRQDIAEELHDSGFSVSGTPKQATSTEKNFAEVKPADLKKAGFMPESAYPDLDYKDFPNGDKRAFFVVNGERYKASLNGATQRPELDTSAIARNAKGSAKGNMISYELTGLSEQAKKDWNKRFAASADLFHRGFDLFTSVPSKARENILSVWKKIAENPDAFEFAKADKATGKTVKEVAQSVADQMMKDSRYEVEIVGPKEHRGTADFGIKITDTKTGVDGFADVEFHQRDKEVTMHVQDLKKGSSMGKPIYQIGQAFADKFKARMEADPQGLLGVNNYRRTEQAFSGALRSGNFDTMQPGIGQRIYGWNERAKTPEQQERNFVRMALASTRNALEFVPDIKNFGYDMATDKFYFKDRPRNSTNDLIAGNKIKTMLEDKDARVGSISRSTLARAAVTLDAIDGKVDVPGKIAKPVLYSKKQGPEELKYEHNYLVPEIDGFKDGKVAQMPPVLISKDGISRNFPSMPVRIRVGEHQRDEKFNEQYGLQHRIENRQQYEYRGYQTPDIGKDSTAEVERASRDIALGVLTGKTVYADNSGSKIYLHSPEQNRMTVLQKETDSEGNPFWNVKSSMPQTNEQMMGKFKAPTSINGSMVDGTRTQQSSGILTGILNKLKEPGSFLASSESYSLDEGNRLFKSTVAETPKLQSPARVLARDENGKIILNKNKADTTYSKRELPGEEMLGKVQTHLSDLIDHGMEKSGVYNALAPMSAGTQKTRALAQAWINSQRKADYQWNKIDETITKNFTPEQRTKMWNAADEQNELLATGQDVKGKGIDRLTPEERATVEGLRGYGEELLKRAKDVGMFKGDGVPYWTPRMMAMVDESGEYSKPGGEGQQASSSGTGRNLTTSSSNLKQRKYLTSAETEAAMQAKGGELVRDIRTMPLAMGKLEKAIAGRELVNQIKQLGHATGTEMVSDHAQEGFFTLDHPSFQTFKPRLEKDDEGKWHVLNDENGNPIFEKTPIYISNDFKGPLKAILSEQSHPAYSAYMLLKSKAMSAIMFSPLIHQQVILGRALAYGGLKTPMFYWTGNAAKKDFDFMQKMIGSGMVPIGNHNNMLDVGDLARGIGKTGGYGDLNESWVGLGARDISNSLSKMLGGKGEVGDVIKSGIDKAGDFWHNTLLWNRVGDLQAGIAKDVYDKLIAKGADENAATTVAAHIANRYAGAVGKEAMSDTMHRAANILLFSKSFNAGNVGSVKDTFYGLPAGLKAQLFEGSSPEVAQDALSFAKSKARWGLVKDLAAALIITSLVQDWFKRNKDAGWKEQLTDGLDGYQKRLADAWTNAKENPLSASSYNPYRLSSTHVNEPGKEERVDMGAQPNSGRHEYMRLPTGKVIEDLIGWTLHPVDTFGKKLSPLASTIKGLSTNDKNSFGTPIFDPSDTTMHKAMDVAKYLVGKQMPMDQIETGIDAYKGKATQLDKDKLEGNMTGLTISQGHPQGPEAGVAAKVEERVKASKAYTLEFVKHDLKYDNVDKARERLEGIGLTPRETTLLINRLQNPHDQMSGAQRKKFNQHASDEDRKTMDEVNQ